MSTISYSKSARLMSVAVSNKYMAMGMAEGQIINTGRGEIVSALPKCQFQYGPLLAENIAFLACGNVNLSDVHRPDIYRK
jgi:hypothetical protein